MKNLSLIAAFSLFAAATLAAPVPDSTELAVEVEARTPVVGFLLRGARKLPGKAGKKSLKEQAKGGKETKSEKKQLDAATKRWSKYLGKEQNRECVKGWQNKFKEYGGFNAAINCDKHKDTNSIGYRASEARRKAFSKIKKREFEEDELVERDLEEDLEEREFDVELEERDFDVELEEREFDLELEERDDLLDELD